MATAEIITIGTEILLGEIIDTNTPYLARLLRDTGIDLYRTTTVGDNVRRIAEAIQQAMERCDIIITTGGLGPTVDDPTRDAVALALHVETEYRPELWEQVRARFRRYGRMPTENNKRQAYVPQGALAVENPVGTAPAFIVETGQQSTICLPGVPREMEYLMENAILPYLKERYGLVGVIKSRILHTSGVGESQIDDLVGDLERLSNPTVGLAAHAGQVDVRVTAKADSLLQADTMIQEIEEVIRQRLGDCIYGVDGETLESAAFQRLNAYGWRLGVQESGLEGELTRRLASSDGIFAGGQVIAETSAQMNVLTAAHELRRQLNVEVALVVALYPGSEKQTMAIAVVTPTGERVVERSYGGPPRMASLWATNLCLDLLRKL
ncbi:MAG: competence/damage-inducible protein A [Chloroflexota bacterium]|nr:MAG: competence/damage-inducible protein A [Chloroflexota bacterium]